MLWHFGIEGERGEREEKMFDGCGGKAGHQSSIQRSPELEQ